MRRTQSAHTRAPILSSFSPIRRNAHKLHCVGIGGLFRDKDPRRINCCSFEVRNGGTWLPWHQANQPVTWTWDEHKIEAVIPPQILSARQEIGESRRWPPSTSPVPICTASGTTRSNLATAQRQRLIPDNS